MNNRLIFYTTTDYKPYADRLMKYVSRYSVPYHWYDEAWLRQEPFWNENKYFWQFKRGGGYWVWKPYIIKDALRRYPDERIVYVDASVGFDYNPQDYMTSLGLFCAIRSEYRMADWTKRDCFVLMNCDSEEYWNAKQLWSGQVCVTAEYEWVMDEWQKWLLVPEVVTDKKNTCGLPNLDGFRDHRHDQSILSLIVLKHGLSTRTDSVFYDV